MAEQQSKRILLVDDEEDLREVMALNLEYDGFVVRTAGTFNDVYVALSQDKTDVLLCDHMMPEGDAFVLFAELAKRQLAADKVVLMSGFLSKELEERARAAGVAGCLQKPIAHKDLQLLLG